MKKTVTLLLLALSLWNMASAQDDTRPGWTRNTPKAGNNTYVYVVERGGGTTVNEAINNAILKVLRTTMMRIGAVVSWDEVSNSLQNGGDWGTVAMKYNIPVNKVCECVEQKTENGYRVAVLCQVAKNGNVYPDFDEFTGCSDVRSYNNGIALLKSALLPGLGQMGKRHVGTGLLIMSGELVLVGGSVASYFVAQSDLYEMRNGNMSTEIIMSNKSEYDRYRIINLSCLSAAGLLYVYNLISAYTLTPKYKNNDFSFAPLIVPTEDGFASGLSLTINF